MDEFGVLTERYGLKPQGKSAPMAASKRSISTDTSNTSWNFGSTTDTNAKGSSHSSNTSWNSKSGYRSTLDDGDIFKSTSSNQNAKNFGGFDDFDVFGGLSKSSNVNDMLFPNFGNSGIKTSSVNDYVDDDIFGGMPGVKNPISVDNNDILGSFATSTKQNSSVDNLLDDFSGFGPKSSSWNQNNSGGLGDKSPDFDQLLPGFGGRSQPDNRAPYPTSASADDPFVVLESFSASTNTSSGQFVDPLDEFSIFESSHKSKPQASSHTSAKLKPPPKPTQIVNEGVSSIDELEDFAMGRVRRSDRASYNAREAKERQNTKPNRYKEAEDAASNAKRNGEDDLESFFASGPRSSSVPKSRATTEAFTRKVPEVAIKTSSGVSSSAKKASFPSPVVDDFTSFFGVDPLFGAFEEVPGESEERRRARMDRHLRTQDRVAQAVADMNQRDRQTQLEQEERRRIATTLDADIKRWADGKKDNMRALLSSLQNVLWPGCGWKAVPLMDLITSTAVKKVYRKAMLYVHPDKVQKGATLEQKYTAEKVFDVLKEAWNKFNKDELS